MFNNKLLRYLALGTSMASSFVVSVLMGLFAGNFLDQKYGTAPWLLLVGVFSGIGLGVISSVHIIKLLGRNDDSE